MKWALLYQTETKKDERHVFEVHAELGDSLPSEVRQEWEELGAVQEALTRKYGVEVPVTLLGVSPDQARMAVTLARGRASLCLGMMLQSLLEIEWPSLVLPSPDIAGGTFEFAAGADRVRIMARRQPEGWRWFAMNKY